MNRREVLATFLGASAAAFTGCGDAPPALPPGELLGADQFGHTLRNGPPPAPKTWQEFDVVIVGGGVAGLTAAWRLARKHPATRFVLLELDNDIGGTSRSGKSTVTAYPWGGHYIPVPQKSNPDLVGLLNEMGIVEGSDNAGDPIIAEQHLCRDPQERVYHHGVWHEGLYLSHGASNEDLRQFAAFKKEIDGWIGWRDGKGRPAFTLPVAHCSDDAVVTALDKLTLAEYLDSKGYTSSRLRWYIEYACRDDHATTLETTSAWAGLFYFASRVKAPGDQAEPLITFPEGNGRLVRHLASAGVQQIQTDIAAAELLHDAASGRVHVLARSKDSNESVGFAARRVIFAAPQFVARHVIRDYRENPPQHIAAFQYGAWMVANLHLRERPVLANGSFAPCWDNVIYDSPSLGYVIATHQTEQSRGPTVFTYYYPFCDAVASDGRKRLSSGNREAWAEVALADLSVPHPDIRHLTERIDVMRWGHGMIQPRPGFMSGSARQKALRPYRQIHFAHSDLSGLALFEEAFHQGIRAADEAAKELI